MKNGLTYFFSEERGTDYCKTLLEGESGGEGTFCQPAAPDEARDGEYLEMAFFHESPAERKKA